MNIQANRLYNQIYTHIPIYLILIGNILFLQYNAFRHFNFYDMPFLLDGGWRILSGQRPYVDFLYVSGPIHLYMNALFFKIFGFGKTAIFSHLIFAHTIVILSMYLLARKFLPQYLVWLVTILTTTSFYWPISHPWHNQTAHQWSLLALTLFVWQYPFKDKKTALLTAMFMGFMATLSLLTKTNTGGIYGLLFFFLLLMSAQRVQAIIGYIAGVFVGLIVGMALVGAPMHYLEQMRSYSQMILGENRVARLLMISSWFTNYYWIPYLIVVANAAVHWKKLKEMLFLYVGMYPLTIFTIFSSDILVSANIFLWGVVMTLSFIVMYKVKDLSLTDLQKKIWRLSTWALVVVTICFITLSVKYGLELKVWTYSGKNPVGSYALKAEPLQGWLCDEQKGKGLDGISEFINENVPKEDTLLVVTDLQILYALTGRQSFVGMPLFIVEDNRMPVPDGQATEVRDRIKQNLPAWIVTDMASYMNEIPYLGLKPSMKIQYRIAKDVGAYAIFQKIR